MGGSDVLGVDTGALHAAASALRGSAAALEEQSRRVGTHGPAGNAAGRNYGRQGLALHHGFERIASCLHNWGTAAGITADVFDRAATEYERLDQQSAAAVTGVGR
ncbi:hypothetical protein [Nocardia sp. NPDC020380]|uniref:hypothetical protein n=1 Tax=Nocardia sp. NPDC020380 TaxID=3364309 RepID=UPI0037BDDAA3